MKTYALACPRCGAGLKVAELIESFTCSYCDASVRVERGGGIVGLQLLGDEVRRVRAGTDKTAAELAIMRLTKELAVLEDEAKKLGDDVSSYEVMATKKPETWDGLQSVTTTFFVAGFGSLFVAYAIGWGPLIYIAWGLFGFLGLGTWATWFQLHKGHQVDETQRLGCESVLVELKTEMEAKLGEVDAMRERLKAQRAIADGDA
jgi:hypothetical protein